MFYNTTLRSYEYVAYDLNEKFKVYVSLWAQSVLFMFL